MSASTSASPREASTSYLIANAHHAMRTRLERLLRPYGLTSIQYTILHILSGREGLSSADLSRRFYVTPQTMGEMIAGLESRALIERRGDPANRRVLRIHLTAAGSALLEECAAEASQLEKALFRAIEPKRHKVLREILRDLVFSLREDEASKAQAKAG